MNIPECSHLPDEFFLEEVGEEFEGRMKFIDIGNWVKLAQCRNCGALWAIDEDDKFHHRVVSRVLEQDNWHGATEDQRKKLLLSARGGTTDQICNWSECESAAVKSVVFCVDHLYATGARK